MKDHPYSYGAGTRLSNAYTLGRAGLPCPKWAGDKTSAAYKAWEQGHEEHIKLTETSDYMKQVMAHGGRITS